MKKVIGPVLALVLSAAIAPSSGSAQQTDEAVSLLAGPSEYDLAGTGIAPFVAARLDLPVGRRFLVEPGVTYMWYECQGGDRIRHVLPEAQLQIRHPGEVFRPYLGIGAGASWAVMPTEDEVDLTISAAGGVRVRVGSGWILRGELRVRVIDPWTSTTADWGLGVGRTF